jgi:hypothetical protein
MDPMTAFFALPCYLDGITRADGSGYRSRLGTSPAHHYRRVDIVDRISSGHWTNGRVGAISARTIGTRISLPVDGDTLGITVSRDQSGHGDDSSHKS